MPMRMTLELVFVFIVVRAINNDLSFNCCNKIKFFMAEWQKITSKHENTHIYIVYTRVCMYMNVYTYMFCKHKVI